MPETQHPGILFNPHAYDPAELGGESRQLMKATIAYFESLGKDRITLLRYYRSP